MAHLLPFAYFENQIVPIWDANLSIASSAVLYWLSVYSVFPIFSQESGWSSFRLRDHFQRLISSAKILWIDTFEHEWNYEKFLWTIEELIQKNIPNVDVFARVTVHVDAEIPGIRTRWLKTVLSIFLYEASPILPDNGARIITSHWRRTPDTSIPSRAKINGSYINSALGKQEALDHGCDDCVFLNHKWQVSELSAANIFMIKNGTVFTPSRTSDILEGINRNTLIQICRSENIPIIESNIDSTELYIADEIFACGTSASLVPIIEIDKRKVGKGTCGDITFSLKNIYKWVLRWENEKYSSFITRFTL